MLETRNKPAEEPAATTAENAFKQKPRDANVVSGGHRVAKALTSEGVDTIFTLCGGHIIDIYDGVSTKASASSTFGTSKSQRTRPTGNSPFPRDITLIAG